ncbi:hypothetical protein LTR70_003739 [Exophiala xenobiotica]|uniref:Uncharacterized protein n=1 Tax=Lithohypha guttulata TaxID=1690604 RepID=A0ABR0KJ42_9EURO|nr:hypothetical protein LTR24_002301 [Lithohypha guttulata]KAK5322791.1 hypothetical protein LTR70_003739 [Exophiala xenobiotica]
MATKILVVGAVQGQLAKAFQKISKLHSKTDFAFALVAGDLFGQEADDEAQALLSGSVAVPLPTYFTVGDTALPQAVQTKLESAGEVCPNLFYLGRKGTLTTTEGIKIVFLGGRQVQNEESITQSIGKYDSLYLENEARVLQGANNAHIVLTNQWPARIESGSNIPVPAGVDSSTSTRAVANLCATLKPRYHFSSSSIASWKREPFVWPMEYSENAETQVTRFESLGSISLKSSEWLSAFTLDLTKPATTEGAQRAAPFTVTTPRSKRKRDALDADPYPGRRYDHSTTDSHRPGGRGRNNKRPKYDPNDCFMCLGKPQFSANMVISIADESFLTSLRGPLPTTATFPHLKSTGNLMIIPMYHAADETAHGRRAPSDLQTEFNEMTRYRHALQHMLLAKANGDLGGVCWEVNRTGIRHFHWQWIACPQAMISKGLVEAAFKVAAEKNSYEKFQACEPDKLLPDRQSDFFRVWIWSAATAASTSSTDPAATDGQAYTNGKDPAAASPIAQADALAAGQDDTEKLSTPNATTETCMYFELPPDQRFNIQFGRTVMSSLLKLEHRADWRSVPAGEGDEARDAEAWKEDFATWDFAMG